jgi:hypothetical protein
VRVPKERLRGMASAFRPSLLGGESIRAGFPAINCRAKVGLSESGQPWAERSQAFQAFRDPCRRVKCDGQYCAQELLFALKIKPLAIPLMCGNLET